MKKKLSERNFYFLLLASFLLFFDEASAQIIDSSFYNWTVYETQETELDYKKCYIVAHPTKSDTNHSSRLNPYLMITRFQKDRSEEVSISSGFEYKIGSEIFVIVDLKQFKFKTKKDIAWTKTRYEDINAIDAILNGTVVRVRSDSAIGTFAIDEYSLKGITKAYFRMKQVCS